jgi:glucans biosynthesis protein C
MFMARSGSPSASSLALSNLRAITILIVVAFHAMLAYLVFIPVTVTDFSSPPWGWRVFPIADGHRFFGFGLFCAWPFGAQLVGAPQRAVAAS